MSRVARGRELGGEVEQLRRVRRIAHPVGESLRHLRRDGRMPRLHQLDPQQYAVPFLKRRRAALLPGLPFLLAGFPIALIDAELDGAGHRPADRRRSDAVIHLLALQLIEYFFPLIRGGFFLNVRIDRNLIQ